MQVKKCNEGYSPRGYLVRLEIGEEVVTSLGSLVRQKRIRSGWLLGIGAVDNVTLGVYDLKRRQYAKRTFKGDHELVNLTGDISWLGQDPVLHIHAVIADPKLKTYGGHLFSARTCVTVEVVLVPWPTRIERKPDVQTGLNLLALARGGRTKHQDTKAPSRRQTYQISN
jgi:hypothetical protein